MKDREITKSDFNRVIPESRKSSLENNLQGTSSSWELQADDLVNEKVQSHEKVKDFSFIQKKRVPSPLNADYANLSAEQSRNHIRNESENGFYNQSGAMPRNRASYEMGSSN